MFKFAGVLILRKFPQVKFPFELRFGRGGGTYCEICPPALQSYFGINLGRVSVRQPAKRFPFIGGEFGGGQ